MNTIFIVLPILTLLMFDLGLTLTPSDFRMMFHRPRPVLAGLIGQIIVLPVLAYVLCQLFDISPIYMIGIMLIACSPGGSSSNVFSMLAKGDVALSVSLTALSSVITLFTLPLIMKVFTNAIGSTSNITLPVGNLLVQNIVLMAVPIIIGLLLAKYKSKLASRIHSVLKRIAFPALILLATVFFIQHKETIIEEFPSLGLIITVFISMAMGMGALLSYSMRLKTQERRTIIIEVGMQNAAQAITIACSPIVFNNELIAIPAIVYALMMNVLLLTYVGVLKVESRESRVESRETRVL